MTTPTRVPTYQPHIRVTASGLLGGGAASAGAPERFSFGFALTTNDGSNPLFDANSTLWSDVANDVALFFADANAHIGSGARLTEVKCAHIGADGKYTGPPATFAKDVPGGFATSIRYPPQVSLAVSLVTNTYGARGRGRFYLPNPVAPVEMPDLTIGATTAEAIEGAVATMLRNVNNEPGLDMLDLAVAVASSYGKNHRVTSVRVGRALDTVRSRRRSLVEDYRVPTAL